MRRADCILVLHKVRLRESSKHDELLAQNGLHARLYALRFAEEGQAA